MFKVTSTRFHAAMQTFAPLIDSAGKSHNNHHACNYSTTFDVIQCYVRKQLVLASDHCPVLLQWTVAVVWSSIL